MQYAIREVSKMIDIAVQYYHGGCFKIIYIITASNAINAKQYAQASHAT
jgi:hypothetical protein